MSNEKTQELMMGAVMVLLAYAAYRHFKPSAPTTRAPAPAKMAPGMAPSVSPYTAGYAAGAPSPSSSYDGSPFTSLQDIMQGSTHDIGGYQGRNYLDEIAEPIVSGYNAGDGFKTLVAPWSR